jgi:transposase-like protein
MKKNGLLFDFLSILGSTKPIITQDMKEEGELALNKFIEVMADKYCPINSSKCRKDCAHYRKGFILESEAYGKVFVYAPECKLWHL